MLEKKEKKQNDKTQETTLHSTEKMVCAYEFPQGCVEVEMDVNAPKKEK